MIAAFARVAAFLTAAFAVCACDCVAYTRGPVPARGSDDYRAVVAHLDRAASDVIVVVDNHDLARNPKAARALQKMGLVQSVAGRTPAFTPLAARASVDRVVVSVVAGDAYVRLRVGTQHVDRLVSHVASHGHGYCLPTGNDDDEYGYVSKVDSLNALGKSLLANKMLLVGFGGAPRTRWDGRASLVGAIASIVPHGVDPPFDVNDRLGETMSVGDGP